MEPTTSYQLDPQKIIDTIAKLQKRVGERFPDSGLFQVCGRLLEISEHMKERADWIGRPLCKLRIIAWASCALILILTLVPVFYVIRVGEVDLFQNAEGLSGVVTLLEAAINDLVLIGAAMFFFLTIETRFKRQRALRAIHELRSIAHVIDMHQLTKDPHRLMSTQMYQFTGLSPRLRMTPFLLRRYLSYCTEMLSLSGKIAAVYVQAFDDAVALASASELEQMTTGLSNKIWQKMSILHEEFRDEEGTIQTG